MNTYTDTSYRQIRYTSGRSEWGAWIGTGYGRNAVAKPTAGTTVQIRTKAGEVHTRTVKRIVNDYKSGVIVALEPDTEIAATAQARYNAKVAESNTQRNSSKSQANHIGLCPHCHSYCYGDCQANR